MLSNTSSKKSAGTYKIKMTKDELNIPMHSLTHQDQLMHTYSVTMGGACPLLMDLSY